MSMMVNPFILGSAVVPLTRNSHAEGIDTVSMPSHAAGDMIIAFAFRDGSTTPPTVPAGQGWNTLSSTGASNNSGVVAYKVAASGSEGCGTFTNATGMTVIVIRGSGTLALGGNSGWQNGFSTNISYLTVTMDKTDGTSMIIAFFGHRSNNIANTPPSPLTNYVFLQDATDTVSVQYQDNPTSFSTVNASVGGTSSGYRTIVIEVKH